MTLLRVAVLGAAGRMGSEVCTAVSAAPDLELAASVDIGDDLEQLTTAGATIIVDFTHPDAVMDHVRYAITHGMHSVVGTSGVGADKLDQITAMLSDRPEPGVLVVPNFAIGAVLATAFARRAARFFDSAEVVELHHARKIDAPSGTAVAAARQIAQARAAAGRGPVPDATTSDPDGARGAAVDGIHVHAVRMPGLVAHLEVLLGSDGELLTIRHDSVNRASFMPGVLAAIRAVGDRPGLTVGLESILLDD